MKKKITLAITLVALVAVAILGGTLAWFTDSKDVTNVVKTGKVAITLTEPKYWDANPIAKENKTFVKDVVVVPNTSFVKDPTITNVGDVKIKVRYKVTATFAEDNTLSVKGLTFTKGEDTTNPLTIESLTDWNLAIIDAKGIEEGAIAPSYVIFDKVNIPSSWGNEYQGKTLNIKVDVQALQDEGTDKETWKDITYPNN